MVVSFRVNIGHELDVREDKQRPILVKDTQLKHRLHLDKDQRYKHYHHFKFTNKDQLFINQIKLMDKDYLTN